MTRYLTASLALLMMALVVLMDSTATELNPSNAPSIFSLGSGALGGGAFCGELPR